MWWTTTICRLPKGSALPREVDDKKVEGENKAVNINMEMEDKKVEGKNRVVAKPSPFSGIWYKLVTDIVTLHRSKRDLGHHSVLCRVDVL